MCHAVDRWKEVTAQDYTGRGGAPTIDKGEAERMQRMVRSGPT
jgi:hypothetical protein